MDSSYLKAAGQSFDLSFLPDGVSFPDGGEIVVFPGFCDVHVHFREPGFFYKESIRTGSFAAAAGGFTAVCTMPNLSPVPDCREHLQEELDIIARDALVNVYPYGAITKGERGEELSDMEGMSDACIAFSDDGRGLQSEELMREAMKKAKSLGKIIAAHCEVNELLNGGYIGEGAYAAAHGHRTISNESEWRQIERDLRLSKETGCAYHICHVSCKESVELIRKAKAEGVDVTAETAPHYLTLTEQDLQEDGRFKMNPPLRQAADRDALIEGILDGIIDMIGTDHAPHSAEEKAKGLEKSAFGIVGLETSFPVMYTKFVKTGILSLDKLVGLMAVKPRERFLIPLGNDCTVWDLKQDFTVDPERFYSKGRSTPYRGETLSGRCLCTVCGGKAVFLSEGKQG